MERLLNGGKHPELSGDFILYVLLVCFVVIILETGMEDR